MKSKYATFEVKKGYFDAHPNSTKDPFYVPTFGIQMALLQKAHIT